ncbi:hypothetical protein BaRGS_00023089, partial [Batillaria attramentaria]
MATEERLAIYIIVVLFLSSVRCPTVDRTHNNIQHSQLDSAVVNEYDDVKTDCIQETLDSGTTTPGSVQSVTQWPVHYHPDMSTGPGHEKQQSEDELKKTLKPQRTETADENFTRSQLLSRKTRDNETVFIDLEDSPGANTEKRIQEKKFKTKGMSISTWSPVYTQTNVMFSEAITQLDPTTMNTYQALFSTGEDRHVTGVTVQSKITTGTAALNTTHPWKSNIGDVNQSQWTINDKLESTRMVLGSRSSETSIADDAVTKTSPSDVTSTEVPVEPHQTRFSTTEDVRTENKVSVSQRTTSWKASSFETHTHVRNLNLTSINISSCFRQEKYLHFHTSEGFISYNYNDVDNNLNSSQFFLASRFCNLILHVPSGLVVHFQLIQIRSTLAFVDISDLFTGLSVAMLNVEDELLTKQDVYSFNRSVRITVNSQKIGLSGLYFQFRFTSVPFLERPHLELETVDGGAYTQTPGWDGKSRYPENMRQRSSYPIGADLSVMISFDAYDLNPSDYLDIRFDGRCPDNLKYYTRFTPDMAKPPTFLMCRNSSGVNFTMTVTFSSYAYTRGHFTGFRMLVLVLSHRAVPERLPGDKWNCSRWFWTFRRHFRCDFRQDCVNGEDERDCSYKNHTCGEGWVLLEGKCYLYVRDKQRLSWNDASAACHDRGGYLASLNTPDEYLAVVRFLAARSDGDVYIGLQSPSPILPQIYKSAPRWSDGTIAYFAFVVVSHDRPFCAYYAKLSQYGKLVPNFVECWYQHTQCYLCELKTVAGNSTKPDREESGIVISTPTLWMSSSTVPYTQCPTGHVTHDFLACDVQSACWSRDDLSESCLAPLFTCTNSFERVHYTFVCDYRPDCSDASDENFCVVPPCRMTEFSCGNKQVPITPLHEVQTLPSLLSLDVSRIPSPELNVHMSGSGVDRVQAEGCVPHEQECDGVEQCVNGADEKQCSGKSDLAVTDITPPASIDFVSGNPRVTMTPLHEVQTLPSLLSLDVSRIPSPELNVHFVHMFPNLETLNMSGSGVER